MNESLLSIRFADRWTWPSSADPPTESIRGRGRVRHLPTSEKPLRAQQNQEGWQMLCQPSPREFYEARETAVLSASVIRSAPHGSEIGDGKPSAFGTPELRAIDTTDPRWTADRLRHCSLSRM